MAFAGTLLPYQPVAVDRMVARGNQLVAYDMGLGKTVLTIAALERLMDEGSITEPGLVIALSSLKYQWADAVRRFSNDSVPLVVDGTKDQRKAQYAQARDWVRSGVDIVILNYEQVVNDWDEVRTLPRGFLVVDEATAIKSFKAHRTKRVKALAKDVPVRFALTGTPMENGKPEELFSIMQFVDAEVLGHYQSFDHRYCVRNSFGGVERYKNLDHLHARLRAAMVRKRQTDADVAPHLPRVTALEPLRPAFDRAGLRLYRHVAADLAVALDEATALQVFDSPSGFALGALYGSGSGPALAEDQQVALGRIAARLQALRLLCCHPDLVKDQTTEYAEGLRETGLLDRPGTSPKLDALVCYVNDFLDTDPRNKVVVFSHWVAMTVRIGQVLSRHGAGVYNGTLNARQKETVKERFQTSPQHRVLVSSDAGGYGVDLPQANLLINYDLPDTAGSALQRNARIKRASSTWTTIAVLDLLMSGSIEERMHDALSQKSGLASAVLDGEGVGPNGAFILSLSTLRQFLGTSALLRA